MDPDWTRRVACLAIAVLAACTPDSKWQTAVGPLDEMLLSVGGTGPDDVWVVGGTHTPESRSVVLHFDGTAWKRLDAGVDRPIWWVHALARDDVWFAGEGGTILRWDGRSFARMESGAAGSDSLFGIWGTRADSMWAVGGTVNQGSTVLRYDGTAWRRAAGAPEIAGSTWFKVWGAAEDEVWLAGDLGRLAKWNGQAFESIDLSALGIQRQRLTTVAGRARDDVWIVGGLGRGVALRYDGREWRQARGIALEETPALMGVSVGPRGDVALTGMSGAKLRGRDGAFVDEILEDPPADLHSVVVFGPDDVFAVGGSFATLRRGVVAHYGAPIAELR